MKKKILTFVATSLLVIVYVGCNGSNESRLRDPRDGKIYKTVKIGEQWWMAENLNYAMEDSYCYDDNLENCLKYGRLYKWSVVNEACPVGWHLPSKSEFEILSEAVGGETSDGMNWAGVAKSLKSQNGWNAGGNGSDSFGFSAIPAGTRLGADVYSYGGEFAYFWSASEYGGIFAYEMTLRYDLDSAYLLYYDKSYGISVRCLKD